MFVFLWSPTGKLVDMRGSRKNWEKMLRDFDTSNGTWFYGPLEDMPIACLPPFGWLIDCHNVWDHKATREVIQKTVAVLSVISYVKYNGFLAIQAIKLSVDEGCPIIIVYRHEHKAAVMTHLQMNGSKPIGLIDDRQINLQPVVRGGFKAIHCLTAVTDIPSKDRRIIVAKTLEELKLAFVGVE